LEPQIQEIAVFRGGGGPKKQLFSGGRGKNSCFGTLGTGRKRVFPLGDKGKPAIFPFPRLPGAGKPGGKAFSLKNSYFGGGGSTK